MSARSMWLLAASVVMTGGFFVATNDLTRAVVAAFLVNIALLLRDEANR